MQWPLPSKDLSLGQPLLANDDQKKWGFNPFRDKLAAVGPPTIHSQGRD